ncbi:SGNH/GDSL hydrolase family protein [Actinoplanes sp. NPDC051633]|uniref:SGNH/GDSL hydrolase family protein n=1 Tax=Actinoplanes sp. NPDC051633 TaxID=3155670 RepID=UPI0034289E13
MAATALAALMVAGCGTPARTVSSVPAARVVTVGDSVPAGTACDCEPFPDLYARRIGAGSDNLAQPGFTSADVRDQLLNQVGAAPARAAVAAADVVLVMAGANDVAAVFDAGGGSYTAVADTVRRNVIAAVDTVHRLRPSASVLIFGYWNVVEDGDVGRADYGDDGVAEAASATEACNDALARAAASTGAVYVDTAAAFKGDSGERDPTALLTPDGDHPDAAGHAALAAAAYAALPRPRSSPG